MGYSVIKLRRGTLYENSVNNVLLDEGEIILEAPDTGVGTGLSKFKIGDGTTRYRDLPYAFDGSSANSILGGSASEFAVIQLRSDTSANWKALNPVLTINEIAYDTDHKWFKIGDGSSTWDELGWFADQEFDRDKNQVDDYGDEDEDVITSASNPSIVYLDGTGNTEYQRNILPDDWNDVKDTEEEEENN